MAWFTRFTRFGDIHLVFGQEAPNSCGIASVMMCVFKINKLVPGRSAVHANTEIYRTYGSASGSNYDGTAYTYTNHLVTVLNQLNCGQWCQEQLGANDVSQKIVDVVGTSSAFTGLTVNVNPMIVLVDWDAGGAHFVVVDTVRTVGGRHYATVCDPWDANVHVQRFLPGTPFNYDAGPVAYSWDAWGTHHEYGGAKSGAVEGAWVIYRVRH